jgi:hypothetical protein
MSRLDCKAAECSFPRKEALTAIERVIILVEPIKSNQATYFVGAGGISPELM